jgi:hypothetical protein
MRTIRCYDLHDPPIDIGRLRLTAHTIIGLMPPRREFSLESPINNIVRAFRQRIVAFRASVVFRSFTLFPAFSLFPALNHVQAQRGNRLVKARG